MKTIRKTTFDLSEKSKSETYRVYKRRWFMLVCFFVLYFSNSAQFCQYTIIVNIIQKYYNINATMVNMTSVVFFIPYLPLIVPASYVINKKGIRFTLLLAASGNFIGSLIKVFSVNRNGFYIGLFGQTVLSVSQTFLLSMPPKLAGIWFDSSQMSTACTIGIFGSELGIAANFLLTPIVVQDKENMEDIGHDLLMLFSIVATATLVILIIIILFFHEKPPTAPSEVQKLKSEENLNTIKSFKTLLANQPFVLLLFAFAINIGINNTLDVLINPIILQHFKTNGEQFAGRIGVCAIVCGFFSAIGIGMILDKTKKFKECLVIAYCLSVVGLLAFTFAVASEIKILVYLSSLVWGLSVSGYYVVGYETGVELTYPESEFNSSGLLMGVSQVSAAVFTFLFTYIMEMTNDFWTIMCMVILLLIGAVLTILTRNVRKRQEALESSK